MKLNEIKIIKESIEFNACTLEKGDDDHMRITPHNMRQEETDCPICDGEGENTYGGEVEECGMCEGTGKIERGTCDGPTLSVSNINAGDIIRNIIGQEFDYVGMVEKKDMPKLKQKLIKMLNMESERGSMRQDPTDNDKDRPMVRSKDEHGQDRIHKQGARMIGGGRSDSEVHQTAKTMLDMLDYAQKHDLVISWG